MILETGSGLRVLLYPRLLDPARRNYRESGLVQG